VPWSINCSHLLKEFLAKQQDAGGDSEDNNVLYRDINRSVADDSGIIGGKPGLHCSTTIRLWCHSSSIYI
jgi:hypothetical protein